MSHEGLVTISVMISSSKSSSYFSRTVTYVFIFGQWWAIGWLSKWRNLSSQNVTKVRKLKMIHDWIVVNFFDFIYCCILRSLSLVLFHQLHKCIFFDFSPHHVCEWKLRFWQVWGFIKVNKILFYLLSQIFVVCSEKFIQHIIHFISGSQLKCKPSGRQNWRYYEFSWEGYDKNYAYKGWNKGKFWLFLYTFWTGSMGWYNHLLVRAECVRQHNEVAIILGIISLSSSSLFFFFWAFCSEQTWLADDFKGKPPHWLLGVNSYCSELSASTSLMSYGDGRQT